MIQKNEDGGSSDADTAKTDDAEHCSVPKDDACSKAISAPLEFEAGMLPRLGQRDDVDGLRAVAVVPVLLYHFELAFPGGFCG
eukprot:COSAG01_NODE_57752_length_310_cov_0.957346_1_plen_82_part_01